MNTQQKINIRFIVLLAFVLLAGIIRLTNSFSSNAIQNFTPLGAMALFGGSYFKESWKAYLMPLLTLFLTDIILNRFLFFGKWVFFYDGFLWVYGVFAFIVLLGNVLIRKINVKNIVLAGIVASLTHWIVTDFGVWLGGGINPFTGQQYPQTLEGYWICLGAAIPYLQNFLLGTFSYSIILFGVYELAKLKFPVLAKSI